MEDGFIPVSIEARVGLRLRVVESPLKIFERPFGGY